MAARSRWAERSTASGVTSYSLNGEWAPTKKTPDRLLHRRRGVLEPPALHLRGHHAGQRLAQCDCATAHRHSMAQRITESTAKDTHHANPANGILKARPGWHICRKPDPMSFCASINGGQHVPGALVQQPHNLRVQVVNRLAMFGKAHGFPAWPMPREESNQRCGPFPLPSIPLPVIRSRIISLYVKQTS